MFHEIVVLHVPDTGETLIKRVKGLPGDVIDFKDIPNDWRLSRGEYKVPVGTYYVLGDNRPVSQDSRELGPFERSDVVGKVVIYGSEPWLFGILAAAILAVAASCLAAVYENRTERRQV